MFVFVSLCNGDFTTPKSFYRGKSIGRPGRCDLANGIHKFLRYSQNITLALGPFQAIKKVQSLFAEPCERLD